jgi:5-methylcytosine-specific restriction endonuclease McrA
MDEIKTEYRRFLSDHPGHPLGPGAPLGRTLRLEEVFVQEAQQWRGESHLMAWQRICRWDPCAYCGREASLNPDRRTLDHVEPRGFPTRGLGGANSWLNSIGSCNRCNGSKAAKSLLHFMLVSQNLRLPTVSRRVVS